MAFAVTLPARPTTVSAARPRTRLSSRIFPNEGIRAQKGIPPGLPPLAVAALNHRVQAETQCGLRGFRPRVAAQFFPNGRNLPGGHAVDPSPFTPATTPVHRAGRGKKLRRKRAVPQTENPEKQPANTGGQGVWRSCAKACSGSSRSILPRGLTPIIPTPRPGTLSMPRAAARR